MHGHGRNHPAPHPRGHPYQPDLRHPRREGLDGQAARREGGGPEEIRAAELEQAAAALALGAVELWDYPDGAVRESDQQEITQRIWDQISKLKPRAVVAFGPDGAYGHPDHVCVGACTDAAVAAMTEGARPALYHVAIDGQIGEFYSEILSLTGDNRPLPLAVQDHTRRASSSWTPTR